MPKSGPNLELIRAALIVLFVVISFVLRAARMPKKQGPTPQAGSGLDMRLGELLRGMKRQAEAPMGEQAEDAERLQLKEPFQQPPKIEPESSFLPSLLLLALLVCLCLMAYHYWAG